MNYIIGANKRQPTLMPESIEDYVSEENPVRVIDAYVDRLDLNAMGFVTGQENGMGRPMYCIEFNLYGKELVAIDGSKFKAWNSKDNNFTVKKIADRIARLDKKIEEYMQELEKQDREESASDKSPEEMKEILKKLKERKTTYESYEAEMKAKGETKKSLTDPGSRLMKGNGKMDVSYNVQMAVDSKNKMVVEFSVGNNGNAHNQMSVMSVMSEKSAEMFETNNFAVVADKGYNGSTDIAKTLELGIIPHVAGCDIEICIPVSEEEQQEVTSHTERQTIYVKKHNVAICPMGKVLYPRFRKSDGTAIFSNSKACLDCKYKCTKRSYKKFEISMKADEFSKEYDDSNLFEKILRFFNYLLKKLTEFSTFDTVSP